MRGYHPGIAAHRLSDRILPAAIAVPVLLALAIGNALLLVFLLGGWFIDLIYAVPGFPGTDLLDRDARRELAADGMAAIRPLGPGIDLLRQAEVPGGAPAFNEREIVHMEDVKRVVNGFAIAWLIGLVVTVTAWVVASGRVGGAGNGGNGRGNPDAPGVCRLRRAAVDAAWAVLGLIVLVGLLLLIAFEPIFEGFHAIFFSGDSWRFASEDTLLQLYPEMFWGAAGTAIVVLVAAQCLAVIRGWR